VDGWVGDYDAQSLERALELKAQLNASAEEKAQLQLASERLQAALEHSQMQVKATLASTSWRLTAPLRAGGNLLRALQSFRRRQ
jgi:hypothetical protein